MTSEKRGSATSLSTSASGVPDGYPHASPAGKPHTHVVNPPNPSTPFTPQDAHRRLDILASEHDAFVRSLRPYPWEDQ